MAKKVKKRKVKFKDNPKPPYADPHGAQFDKPMRFYPSDQYVNNYDLIDWSDDGSDKSSSQRTDK